MKIPRFNSLSNDFPAALQTLKTLPASSGLPVSDTVRDVLQALAQPSPLANQALLDFTQKWDGHLADTVDDLLISPDTLQSAWENLDADLQSSLTLAHQRILRYHEMQMPPMPNAVNWQEGEGSLRYRWQALSRVALYVPGGKAAYPSSVLMNAIPAKVAGVSELIMLTPTPQGIRNDTVLASAYLCGVDRVFAVGGAQAVGAVAYGRTAIPRCDKIVGPGNAWVAEAKRQVFGTMGIDMVAGPSEVLVISDGSGNPAWVAADLMAQAEHDPWAQSILLCTDASFIEAVAQQINIALPALPRADIIQQSLQSRGALILVPDLPHAINISNDLAPEHVMIAVENPEPWIEHIRFAGGIFCGHDSCEVLGDYCAGTNHVLPTFGSARFSSPLSVFDFLKGTAILNLSTTTVRHLAPHAQRLAMSEGLQAHALAAKLRC